MYSFEKRVDRSNSNCIKWDTVKELYGCEEVIPMWIADMDFEIEPSIVKAIQERLEHSVLGYTFTPNSYYDAVISWFKKRFDWNVEKEWIKFSPGVVPGVNSIIAAYTKPGDEVILQTPVYHPFYKLVKNNGCQVIENPLIYDGEKYEMDFENLESIITDRTRMIILCSPHNPVGRVWTKDELKKLGDICIKHNVLIVSDEIHADIIYKPYKHTVFSSISHEFAENSIICTAPNKTFNIAGLQTANIIIKNEKLRKEFDIQLDKHCVHEPNVFGAIAQEAAYSNGEEWYNGLMEYLTENLKFTIDFFEKRIPKIKLVKPEGTYLLWLDCTNLNMNASDLKDFFVKKCKVGFNDGSMFGIKGEMFQRMNIATSREIIKDALERIEREVNKL